MVVSLTDLINPDEDRGMIIDMDPVDRRVEERIEFMGTHSDQKDQKLKAIIV